MNKEDLIPSPKAMRRIILIMWAGLVIYLIIKLLGGNWFEIVCDNQSFINVCNYIDNHLVIKIILCCITSFVSLSLLYLAMLQQIFFKKWQLILLLIVIPIEVSLKLIINNDVVSLLIDVFMLIGMPLILNHNNLTKRFIFGFLILGNIFNLAFQLISLLIKNLAVTILDDNTLVSLIFMIDVYIMLGLYYLYSNILKMKGGEK